MPATTIAFLFPGQGSQRPGMGAPWRDHPSWELVTEASSVAERDVAHLLLEADADELKATHNSQLATMVLSLVVLDAVERLGVEPVAYAGHSLGEYTALVASGAVAFDDGVRLVRERGEAMGRAGAEHTGTMAAVLGLDDDKVEVACARTDGDVWVANYNAPGQVVIAGAPDAVRDAGAEAAKLGAKRTMALPVSGAFHTPFMAPARDHLRKALGATEIRRPDGPVVANVDALPHHDPEEWTGLLGAQLCSPVRWRQSLYRLDEMGVTTYLELGPGNVLSSLTKRTVSGQPLTISNPDELDRLLETLHGHEAEPTGQHEGEHLFAHERVIVSPAAGVFEPEGDLAEGGEVDTGHLLGRVAGHDVRSPFAGSIAGVLAESGERVTASQPIAWLRTGFSPANGARAAGSLNGGQDRRGGQRR
jgi:[acyl-carrier-protein] S-malonyltransferase